MKTLEKKLYDDGIVSHVDQCWLSRSMKIGLIGLASLLCWTSTTSAQTPIQQEAKKQLIETVSDSSKVSKPTKEISFQDAINLGVYESEWEWEIVEEKVWIEPELDKPTSPEGEDGPESVKDSPTKFSIESWLWYSVWWKTFRWNRILWSWKLFKDSKGEIDFFWLIDLDSPLKSKWSGKIILSKRAYKWFSYEWDYTFTWTWSNPARFGLWYWGALWDGTYKVIAYPLNTNWSPISAKVSFWKRIWKDWRLDSFVFVDFGDKSYYGEIEYVHKLAKWIALFLEARLGWALDGKFTSMDSQTILWWIKIDIK